MAKIETVSAKEAFIVQMNGDYNVPFAEVLLTAPVVSGQVAVEGTVTFIAAAAGGVGDWVRGMVRGNPTTVNKRALTGLTAPLQTALEANGVVFVDGEASA